MTTETKTSRTPTLESLDERLDALEIVVGDRFDAMDRRFDALEQLIRDTRAS